ncbi:hypothetical protein SCHAM137S_01997 [Streptomyces chartreusis]|nr:hypothetical protein SAMN05216482_0040 [Streptomyces sp. PAN_FS17]
MPTGQRRRPRRSARRLGKCGLTSPQDSPGPPLVAHAPAKAAIAPASDSPSPCLYDTGRTHEASTWLAQPARRGESGVRFSAGASGTRWTTVRASRLCTPRGAGLPAPTAPTHRALDAPQAPTAGEPEDLQRGCTHLVLTLVRRRPYLVRPASACVDISQTIPRVPPIEHGAGVRPLSRPRRATCLVEATGPAPSGGGGCPLERRQLAPDGTILMLRRKQLGCESWLLRARDARRSPLSVTVPTPLPERGSRTPIRDTEDTTGAI